MIYNFSEWCKVRRLYKESEDGHDPFLHSQQKQGDFVYFGVHEISKSYREKGSLPTLDADTVMKKAGQIVDNDHVNQTVKVYMPEDPFHYGYHKLETPDARKKRKKKLDDDGVHEISLPASTLQNITHMLDKTTSLGDNKLWLVIDGNTKFQQELMKEIRKKEVGKRSSVPQNRHYDDWKPSDEEEPEGDDQIDVDDDEDTFEIQDECYNPFNRYFKRYSDVKRYGYYPE